jgi:hypothetical protein
VACGTWRPDVVKERATNTNSTSTTTSTLDDREDSSGNPDDGTGPVPISGQFIGRSNRLGGGGLRKGGSGQFFRDASSTTTIDLNYNTTDGNTSRPRNFEVHDGSSIPRLCQGYDYDVFLEQVLDEDGREIDPLGVESSPCRSDEVFFGLVVKADKSGHELSWELRDVAGDRVMGDLRFNNFETRVYHQCMSRNSFPRTSSSSTTTSSTTSTDSLDRKCFALNIMDSDGDGLCCGGDGLDGNADGASAGFAIRFGGDLYEDFNSPDFGDIASFELCLVDVDDDTESHAGGIGADGFIVPVGSSPTTPVVPAADLSVVAADKDGYGGGWDAP